MKLGWIVVALILAPTTAFAFVQTQTCSTTGAAGQFQCQSGESPKPVKWPNTCVTYYVNELGSADLENGTVTESTITAVRDSFAAWNDVADSGIRINYAGLTNEDRATFSSDQDNANVLIWRDGEWPYASRTAFAITSVTFNPSTGNISDADIEFNGEFHNFTTSDSDVVVDVQNTLTHEAGHFLGLDHSDVQDSTMFGSAPNGEIQKRTLHPDDIDGVEAIYPASNSCDSAVPVPGFFEKPTGSNDDGCCATATSKTPTPFWILAIALLCVARRKRQD